MDQWKRTFLDKLNQAQAHWGTRFEETLDTFFTPAFEECKEFLADNGFKVATPMRELGRRSFKFELAENAYLLLIFRSTGVGEFELRTECFVPASEPVLTRMVGRIADVDESWAAQQLRSALDSFIELLAGQTEQTVEELVGVQLTAC